MRSLLKRRESKSHPSPHSSLGDTHSLSGQPKFHLKHLGPHPHFFPLISLSSRLRNGCRVELFGAWWAGGQGQHFRNGRVDNERSCDPCQWLEIQSSPRPQPRLTCEREIQLLSENILF